MSSTRPAPELDDEQEVDLSSAWQRIKLRWWLPVGGLVVGAILGIALAASAASVWRAQTIIYLGQPFAPLGGGQIQSLATNPRTVNEIVHSETALKAASARSGVPVSRLRSAVSTKEIVETGQLRGVNPLVEISVKGSGKRKVELAADALAHRVTDRVSVYVAQKIKLLDSQVATAETQLDEANARIRAAQSQQATVLADRSIPLDQRLLLTANLNSVITTADARRAALQESLAESQQLLNLAQDVESSRVVERAGASKTTARSSRSSLLVGSLIGLILGTIAALLVDPIAARRNGTAPPTA